MIRDVRPFLVTGVLHLHNRADIKKKCVEINRQGDRVKTVKEITQLLMDQEEPSAWMKKLEMDERAGVQKALDRWNVNYKKKLLKQQALQEKIAFDDNYKLFQGALVAGVDEAGRGPLAGPVVCAAVILPENPIELIGLDDSKKIAKRERERLAEVIKEIALSYAVHIQSAERIDEVNIYQATKESMERAVLQLDTSPTIVLADAMALQVPCQTESIIKGDAKSLAIAAASILAKTTRDALLDELNVEFPMYHFAKNAGYGTADHLEALQMYGPCKHHRKTFEPIKTMLEGGLVD